MIQRLFISCPGGTGNSGSQAEIVSNGRLLMNGSVWEITGNFFRHLSILPSEYNVEVHVSGDAAAMSRLRLLMDELPEGAVMVLRLPLLTHRELEILDLLNKGKGEKQIAVLLTIEYQTVRNHCAEMHKKFFCKTNGQMIVAARLLGMVR